MSLFDRSTIAVERRLIRNGASATFLPVSSLGMEMFHHEYPAIPGKWEIMSPGVDYSRFSSPDRELCRQQIRHRYGIPLDAFVVLFSGMNFELKGLDSILESIALARRYRPEADFRLLVVGRGNVEKYRARAESLGISAAVTFAGTITKGIEEFYRACDALMLLSKFDTFAMVVLEAMAAGLPVIISSNVGARDIVQHGCSGFVVGSRDDVRSCADHLGMLCRSKMASDFGRAAAKAAAMRDWQVTTQQILKIYRSCLEKKGLSP
jgi:UDP-glucose:(heptosyl)LPS alpha-1,3-glucosyltransferase